MQNPHLLRYKVETGEKCKCYENNVELRVNPKLNF